MSLTTLLIIIAIVAAVLTVGIGLLKKREVSWLITYLQSYTGVLFLISGWVKAMDPLGTAFKMEQYFAEFESTLEATWFGFAAPLFPFLSEYAIAFSVFMIIFEIVLGLMLLLGHKPKLTSWLFLLLVVFFTILTGFTFLTGYVPSGENFFSFGSWGPYDANNMLVTDCGCFGDFIKLEPKISFFKDVILLVPALVFIFRHKEMHSLFSGKVRNIVAGLAVVGLLIYCLSNYAWDLPHTDFRPFKEGVNIAERKAVEEEAESNISIIAWKLENSNDGRIIELSNQEYMSNFKSYPKEEWKVIEQVKSEPEVERTKISDFVILDHEGHPVTDEILEEDSPSLMIVSYKLPAEVSSEKTTLADTIYAERDSMLYNEDGEHIGDTVIITDTIREIRQEAVERDVYHFSESMISSFQEKLNPLARAAAEAGFSVYAIFGGASVDKIHAFTDTVGFEFQTYEADDILLKTIIRSNPGLVLLQEGKIIAKWHIKQLPAIEEIKQRIE